MSKLLIFKLSLDFIMTVLLMAAFAYQLTGNLAHEVIGIIIFSLFLLHNVINKGWYKALFKGKYSTRRIIGTAVNFLLVINMVLLAVSGAMLSRDIFSFLGLDGGFNARQLHMMTAHWGLILISVHLGLHWNMILNAMRKMAGISNKNRIRKVVLRLIAIVIAVYGIKSSFDMAIGSKLFMRFTFGYWDFENAAAGFFLAYMSVLGLYTAVTYYALELLQKIALYKKSKK